MNQEIKDRLERALEALREAEHQLRRAANFADSDECGPAADGPAAPFIALAAQVEALIDSVESKQE